MLKGCWLKIKNRSSNLEDLYQSIHQSLSHIIDATNFFIAIVDREKRTLYFPYHVDTKDDDFYPITDFDTNASLTGLVVLKREPLLLGQQELGVRNAKKWRVEPGAAQLVWAFP